MHEPEVPVIDLHQPGDAPGRDLPSALAHQDLIADWLKEQRLALFLDYDGTLTPIVRRPEEATLSEPMRSLLRRLAEVATVAVVSGRDLDDVRGMVGLDELYYAGSHGFDVAGPGGMRMEQEQAREQLPALHHAAGELERRLSEIGGAWVESKRFAVAIHFREAAEGEAERIEREVNAVRDAHPGLRRKAGKKIFELQPDILWDKGFAVRWLLDQLGLNGPDVLPIYVGDDTTDEDAFRALAGRGIGIRIGSPGEPTEADFYLENTAELERFLRALLLRL